MNDPVKDSLENILTSIVLIQQRLKDIRTPDDLLSDADGLAAEQRFHSGRE